MPLETLAGVGSAAPNAVVLLALSVTTAENILSDHIVRLIAAVRIADSIEIATATAII
jgi:hypothetical protein